MATTNWQDSLLPYPIAPAVLEASAAKTTNTNTTAVITGKGKFRVVFTVTANTFASGYDTVIAYVQRNTAAAPSTWKNIGVMCFGDALGIGVLNDVDVYDIIVDNQGDYQMRIAYYVNGSAASLTCKVDLYPEEY